MKPCLNFKVIACRECFKMNVSTLQCNCRNAAKNEPLRKLRLVGDKHAPLIYVDVQIYEKTFPAKINTGIQNTCVNWNTVKWIHDNNNNVVDKDITEIEIPLKINGVVTLVECEIHADQKEEIELGTHFLHFHGFQIAFDDAVVNSKITPIVEATKGTTYLYNSDDGGDLREYLRTQKFFMRRDKPIYAEDHKSNRIIILRKR